VIAGLYEAAAAPDLLPTALEALADLTDSRGALITRPDRQHDGVAYSPSLTDTIAQFFEQDWHKQDLRTTRMVALTRDRVGFRRDQEIVTTDERERSDYYRGFAHAAGVPWFAACGFRSDTGQVLGVSIQRSRSDGAFSDQDLAGLRSLEPHVLAMLRFSLHVASARERERLHGLERVGVPAILFDRTGRIRALNGHAEALLPAIARVRDGRLTAVDPGARDALTRLIAAACAPEARGGESLAPLKLAARAGPDGAAAGFLAQAIPLVGVGKDLFGDGAAILTLSGLGGVMAPALSRLQSAFGLTPTEARVAQAACEGLGARSTAAKLGLSVGAVRFHLKSILPKAGVNRQAAFVALAASLGRA
jgi:DNA-binding CsgD family transcriptional regulator